MAKKDNEIEELMSMMMERLGEINPDLLDDVVDSLNKRSAGEGPEMLDELIDLKSNKHPKSKVNFLDIDLPEYVDFWDYYQDLYPQEDYDDFMRECRKANKKKGRLAKDINAFLDSVPAYYAEDYTLISHQLWMVAAAISKFDLKECHLPLINLLRCEDNVIRDIFMDDEMGSISLYAELCHDHLKEFFDIAIDECVMPFARGIAIGALAKSANYSPKDMLLIQAYLRQIIEHYRVIAAKDRKVAVKIICATALITARMHFTSLMPLIMDTYRSLRIKARKIGALSKVEALMDDEDKTLGNDDSIVDYLEGFLKFQSVVGNPFLDDEDEDFDLDDFDDDDFDDDDYVDYEEIDDDLPDFGRRRKAAPREDVYSLDMMRKINVVKGKVRILGQNLSNAHPKGIASDTDMDYVNFANGIVSRISSIANDITNDDVFHIAMKCTLYYEDVIADAGIWRSFVETMRERYGKPLPFYEVDEENYYTDEPNLEDVRLLVWLARLDSHTTGVANPENPVLMEMAEVIYQYMDEMFERMPVNESLAEYFHKAEFVKDFYEARDAVKWVYLGSYLTSTTKALSAMVDEANQLYHLYEDEAFYQAESTFIFTMNIGPLALCAKDWLVMILNSNGKKKEAQQIEGMEGITTAYHVRERGDNLFGTFSIERADGLLMDLDKEAFDNLTGKSHSADYLYGCVISYDGKWYLSGSAFADCQLRELYEEEVEKYKTFKHRKPMDDKKYDKVIRGNNGSKLFYFKDEDAVTKFVSKTLGLKAQDVNLPLLGSHHDNWTLFLPDASGQVLYLPDVAQLICDPQNPFYDEDIAMKDKLSLPVSVPNVFVCYLMEHKLLPGAGFVSIEGADKGIAQFQDNYDFVIRCLAPEHVSMPHLYGVTSGR